MSAKDVVGWIKGRKWDHLGTWVLLIVLSITVKGWFSNELTSVVDKETASLEKHVIILTKRIDDMGNRITELGGSNGKLFDWGRMWILESAKSGYKKIHGDLELLDKNTQNANAIKMGLLIECIRDDLMLFDRENTLLYMEYFRIDV